MSDPIGRGRPTPAPHSHPIPCLAPFLMSKEICFFDSDSSLSLSRHLSVSKLQLHICVCVTRRVKKDLESCPLSDWEVLVSFFLNHAILTEQKIPGAASFLCLIRKKETVQLGAARVQSVGNAFCEGPGKKYNYSKLWGPCSLSQLLNLTAFHGSRYRQESTDGFTNFMNTEMLTSSDSACHELFLRLLQLFENTKNMFSLQP